MAARFLTLASSALATLAAAQSTFSPARPPSIPLAVRNPYLQTWQQAGDDAGSGNGGYLAGQWPTFWSGAITGWTGLVRVDNTTYTWLGAPVGPALVNQTGFEYTATRSTFQQNVGGVIGLTVEFMSPVTPDDIMRQSLPFSYMNVDVYSLDGKEHDVQLYTDVSGEWASGDRTNILQWAYGNTGNGVQPHGYGSPVVPGVAPSPVGSKASYTTFASETSFQTVASVVHPETIIPHESINSYSQAIPTHAATHNPNVVPQITAAAGSGIGPDTNGHGGHGGHGHGGHGGYGTSKNIAYHQFFLQEQLLFSEINDQTEYGYWYYLTSNTSSLSYQQGRDITVRGNFASSGSLPDTSETNYRAINDDYPVFAFAYDLGSIGAANASALFGIALAQDYAIQFEEPEPKGNTSVPSLWKSYWDTDVEAISFYYNDYSTVSGLATNLDNQVTSDSVAAGGAAYNVITSLSVRQAWGALSYVNTPQTPWIFMKEISSDGNIQTVDVLFPLHPILIYSNPKLLQMLLEPLFILQEAGYWQYAYTIHDLGAHYPNATGHNGPNAAATTEAQPLEECGNIIIMSLAYAQRCNDNAWLNKHYDILRQWNEFLIQEALIPANQISTDDFAGSLANQTNLAIKGIIGIEAMAQIANRTGHAVDGANYTKIAHSYVQQWESLAIAYEANPPHTTLNYGNNDSYSLLYNTFGDKELGLQLVPQSVYEMQSNFYPTVANEYGVPLDTRHTYTKSDWQIFCAAVATSATTKDLFINDIAKYINITPENYPLGDLYDSITGNYPPGITFRDRPVVGGHFAILALKGAPTSGYVQPYGGYGGH